MPLITPMPAGGLCPPGSHPIGMAACIRDAPLSTRSPVAAWEDLGPVPGIATMPTDAGKQIRALHAWEDRVWLGYGDWGANTGPISLITWDGRDFAVQFGPFWTDACLVFRTLDGRLYAVGQDAHMDSKKNPTNQGPDFVVCDGSRKEPVCEAIDDATVFAVHLFDACQWNDALWLAGVRGGNGAVYKSVDGGASWSVAFTQIPSRQYASAGEFRRFYFLAPAGGKLWVQGIDALAGKAPSAWATADGTTWEDGTIDLLGQGGMGWKPWGLADGGCVYLQRPPDGSFNNLYHFDGKTSRLVRATIWDAWGDGETVWVLQANREVHRTTDAETWEVVATGGPPSGRSVCQAEDGSVYVGTVAGHLWRWD